MKTDQAPFAEAISTSGDICIQYYPSIIERDSFLFVLFNFHYL